MSDPLDSVKSLRDRLKFQADRYEDSENETTRTSAIRARQSSIALSSVIDELEEARQSLQPIPVSDEMGDLSDLPPSLVRELALARTDHLEDRIHQIIRAAGGSADIDVILVMLWRRYRDEQKRKFIQNKLYRMGQKGLVFSLPGRKGVYSISKPNGSAEPTDAEAEEEDEFEIDQNQSGDSEKARGYDDLDDEIPF